MCNLNCKPLAYYVFLNPSPFPGEVPLRQSHGEAMVCASCLSSSLWHCQMAHVTSELYPLLIEDIHSTLPFLHECQLSVELRGVAIPQAF